MVRAGVFRRIDRMRYRLISWIDIKKETRAWGIECRNSGLDAWHPCLENGEPMIYYDERSAITKIKELRPKPLQPDADQ